MAKSTDITVDTSKLMDKVEVFEQALKRCTAALKDLEKEQAAAVEAWCNLPNFFKEAFADEVLELLPIQGNTNEQNTDNLPDKRP